MTNRSHARRVTAWTFACVLAGAAPALAYDGQQSWMHFDPHNTTTAAFSQPYDHSFAREWEAHPPRGFPTLAAENVAATQTAIKRYTTIVERGGWPTIPDVPLQPGASGSSVDLLRQRLSISGDFKGSDEGFFGSGYDYAVEKAVKRFQASNGLTPTGIVDKRTIAALNIPAAVRLKQLKVNLTRLQDLTRGLAKRFVVVNIPAAQIEAVEGDHVVSRHAGVVGKMERQTPILRSAIYQLNFNPVWHLPPTVITKDLVPKGRDMQKRGQDVLAKYGIEAFNGEGKKLDTSKINWSSASAAGLTFRQAPGPENPLGFVKINFNNPYSVYMHDTPSQTLFGRNFRAASSGCVRISGIDHLAAWLVKDQGWSEEKVKSMKKSGERLDVNLKKPVPLYFAYITAWATEDGVIQFRRDIYSKDGVGTLASAY
ncbi:MAG: L,D-transpeptidase family protein [Hyphomicrobiaceae bacterium]